MNMVDIALEAKQLSDLSKAELCVEVADLTNQIAVYQGHVTLLRSLLESALTRTEKDIPCGQEWLRNAYTALERTK